MRKFIYILISLLFFSGCIPKTTHTLKSYDLSVDADTKSYRKYNKVLLVKYPTVLGAIGGSRIYYKRDGVTSYYLYSTWSKSLSRLIYKDILENLQKSNRFKEVVGYDSSANANLILEISVVNFYHIVDKDSSYALITFSVKLIDARSYNVIKSKMFEYKKPLNEANAKSFVATSREVIKEFIRDLINFL